MWVRKLTLAVDASVLPVMVASTAENDAEIGARLGVCFTFTGVYLKPYCPLVRLLSSRYDRFWRSYRYYSHRDWLALDFYSDQWFYQELLSQGHFSRQLSCGGDPQYSLGYVYSAAHHVSRLLGLC